MDPGGVLGPFDLRAADRWEAIDEMIGRLVEAGRIPMERRDAIATAVREREKAMSTGIGFGLGLPHASTELVDDVVGIIGRSRAGMEFAALDGKPVHRVILFLVPKGQFQRHMNALAHFAKIARRPETFGE